MSPKLFVILKWILRLIPAFILLMNSYYKLSANPAAIQLFTILNMESWGRIGIGVLEALAAILILYPRTTCTGAILGIGIMAGAIYFHLTTLGLRMNGSMVLFNMAIIVLVCCSGLILANRKWSSL